jgi:hypothetical protein
MKRFSLFAALATSLVLVACGDNPADAVPEAVVNSNEVPSSAMASAQAYTSFAGSLQKSDTDQPLGLQNTLPPTSETEAPQNL